MATSLISTGVEFADATVQTTAAVAGGGSAEIVASGALSDGSTVVINADGTVSVITVTQALSAGTRVSYAGFVVKYNSAVYDETANKVVVFYLESNYYPVAIVGTVSGTSISFGSPVVVASTNLYNSNPLSAVYDVLQQKVVLFYDDYNASIGRSVVGTVSGTTISFGSIVTFYSGRSGFLSATYDANAQKVVVVNYVSGNGFAVVGTVSGTTISFGSPVQFNNVNSFRNQVSYNVAAQKIVNFFQESSFNCYSIVGTVSGTSISFGTKVLVKADITPLSNAYDKNAQKHIFVYADRSNNNYGEAIIGTVSGTAISFGTPVIFQSSSMNSIATSVYDGFIGKCLTFNALGSVQIATISGTSVSFSATVTYNSLQPQYNVPISAIYDSVNQKVVAAYAEGSNSYGVVITSGASNLTSENYIGISDGAYSDTQTATIQLAGAVDDAQSGLTAGRSYYVQSDGTLNTTAGTPSVFAGTAVSSTKLIVKG